MAIKIEPKNKVREKIIQTAVSLLGECGIRKLAQPQIAKKAGVPQGHMTYYFPTRSDLLLAVAERSMTTIAETVIKNAKDFKKDLSSHSLSLLLPLLKNKSRTRMLIGLLVESDENPALRERMQKQAQTAKSLVSLVSGAESDSPEVTLTYATIIGLGVLHYLGTGKKTETQDEENLNQALRLLAQRLSPESV